MDGKVTRMSKVRIELSDSAMQAAHSMASLAGISLGELLEILLLGLVEEPPVTPPHLGQSTGPAAAPAARRRGPGKVIEMDEARARRRQHPGASTRLLAASRSLCERALAARQRADAAGARAECAREAAERARWQASRAVALSSAHRWRRLGAGGGAPAVSGSGTA